MDLSFLPHVNATLNAVACVLLFTGLALIKNRRVEAHRNCMIAAAALSGLFLVSYVIHYTWRAMVHGGSHTPYNGTGWIKGFYYAMLISHIILAITVPVFVPRLIYLGLRKQYDRHRRLARIGFPVWAYVSITGVLIYLMLFWLNPSNPQP